MSRLWTTDI